MTPHRPARWTRSLQWRVLLGMLIGLTLALVLAGFLLSGLFKDHVTRQFQAELATHLEQLTARLAFDATGQPLMDPAGLTDPRWHKPFSGRYWQINTRATDPAAPKPRPGVLRSRSLWDQVLQLPADVVADGSVHTHTIPGPDGHPLLALERSVRDPEQPAAIWTLIVAADARDMQEATEAFSGTLAASLGVLWVLLALAGIAQVWIGLAPLRALQTEVAAVSRGLRPRLGGSFPAEVQPLADDLNAALDAQANNLARARTQAGNLAHALKTPLSVLQQAADQALATPASPANHGLHELASQVHQQVLTARRQVDWHLKRAHAAAHVATAGTTATTCQLGPALQSLVKVMGRVHADKHLLFDLPDPPVHVAVEADAQDLHEMLGNLLDNACKWTHTRVAIRVQPGASTVTVHIEDNGPGIPADLQALMLARGARLDESAPGSGLGLAIVNDLAHLYGGRLQLDSNSWGGLTASLTLPVANPPTA
ncbi:MAG: HAMP domain-containing histidine kinase [Burkholderiales bacterium]|nr:HAMP domain-containing histidine kinase [Burkholderiales bacterium]